jgi:hypothetical protein
LGQSFEIFVSALLHIYIGGFVSFLTWKDRMLIFENGAKSLQFSMYLIGPIELLAARDMNDIF